ncbi:MAG: HAD family hydrolase [Nanoarchaeota archaeon]|nr:HAD family hydrolase [Nanoarchaeota archaeon]
MIKGIVFDWNKTLVDSTPGYNETNIIKALEQFGKTCDEKTAKNIWVSRERDNILSNSLELTSNEQENFWNKFRTYTNNREENTIILESVNYLKKLNSKIGILTDAPANVFEQEWNYFQKKLDLNFDPIIIARPEYGFERKPNPQGLNHIINIWGLEKHEILMIGNGVEDQKTADNAGVKFYYFNPTQTPSNKYKTLTSFKELI